MHDKFNLAYFQIAVLFWVLLSVAARAIAPYWLRWTCPDVERVSYIELRTAFLGMCIIFIALFPLLAAAIVADESFRNQWPDELCWYLLFAFSNPGAALGWGAPMDGPPIGPAIWCAICGLTAYSVFAFRRIRKRIDFDDLKDEK